MRFGVFMAPFHAQHDQNPTLALRRDIEIVQLLDALGYDEAWFGEHHSGGVETIASPELFCAYLAPKTERIRLGTGVISLPYHNPLWVADRAVQLDHLTRGRFMLGIGPGVLATDASMIGLDARNLRDHLIEDLPVLLHLLRSDEPITVETARYHLVDARMHLEPYSDFEIALTSMFTANGPTLAGTYGLGLLQLTGLEREGMQVLPNHLRALEEAAAASGRSVDRDAIRVVGIMHLAETRDEAIADVRYGLDDYFDYAQQVIGAPPVAGKNFDERLEWATSTGHALVGTADEAVEALEELVEVSDGGIGAFLLWAQEWASPSATRKSYELFARRVMPALQGSARRVEAGRSWAIAERVARAARLEAEREQSAQT